MMQVVFAELYALLGLYGEGKQLLDARHGGDRFEHLPFTVCKLMPALFASPLMDNALRGYGCLAPVAGKLHHIDIA
jgi:hypothetical protein